VPVELATPTPTSNAAEQASPEPPAADLADDAPTPLPEGIKRVPRGSTVRPVDAFQHLPLDDVRTRPMRAQTGRKSGRDVSGSGEPARASGALVSLSQATALLDRQQERDAMLRVVLAYLVHLGDAAYVLVVKGDRIRGHLSRLQPAGEIDLLSGVAVQLASGSTWKRCWKQGSHHVGPPTDDELCRLFYRRLGRPLPDELLNIPIKVRSRTVMLLVVERQRGTFDRAAVPEVLVFGQRLADAVERLILQRKKSRTGATRRTDSAHALPVRAATPARTPAPAETPGPVLASRQPRAPFPSMPDMRVSAGQGTELPTLGEVELGAPTEPEPLELGEAAASADDGEDWDLLITPPDGVPSASNSLAAPEALRALRPVKAARADSAALGRGSAAASARSRSQRHSLSQLISLLGADETRSAAMEALRAQGPEALDAFMRYFPGPILIEREGLTPGRYPPVEEHGPLLALIAEMGATARARVMDELESPVIANRFYATLLTGRLGDAAVAAALVDRLYDPVRLVRQAAREALRRFVDDDAFEAIRERLVDDLGGDHASTETLRWGAQAAATFREPAVVGGLIELIRHPDRQVSLAAHQALREITRHDYGSSMRGWRRWHRKNRKRERLEWLIDALVQDDRELAERAAQELHRLTGQRIPLDVNGPKKEWKRAQREWLAWYKSRD